jgi:hypothetical protein
VEGEGEGGGVRVTDMAFGRPRCRRPHEKAGFPLRHYWHLRNSKCLCLVGWVAGLSPRSALVAVGPLMKRGGCGERNEGKQRHKKRKTKGGRPSSELRGQECWRVTRVKGFV